jgi:hypothetical protein
MPSGRLAGAELNSLLASPFVRGRWAGSPRPCFPLSPTYPDSTPSIPIAYRVSVLEQREGLNWIAHPLAPPVGRGNKSLDNRYFFLYTNGRGDKSLDSGYFFPSQREGIEGWAIANHRLPCQGMPKT